MHNETPLQLNELTIRKGKTVLRAINHSLRNQIIELIHKNGRITVTDIYVTLDMEQCVTSQHLAILREAGIVSTERERKHIFYSINYERITKIHLCAEKLLRSN